MSEFDTLSRLNIVLQRVRNLAQSNANFQQDFIGELDATLDDMLDGGVFGDDGALDPRGDQSKGSFSLLDENIEGYDEQ